MSATQPVPGQVPADYPGKTLGIVGLVLAIVANVIGLIISIVAFRQSKNAGYPNGIAKAGIIVGCITTALGLIFSIVYFAVVVPAAMRIAQQGG